MKLSLIEWDSRNLLLEHLAKTERTVLIGRDIESPASFFSCRAPSSAGYVEIGVISNQTGGSVCCELLRSGKFLCIGRDQAVTIVDLAKVKIHLDERLDGVFFEFVADDSRNQVLAIHELGVVAISLDAHVNWRRSSADILEDWQIIGGSIQLSAMDEETMLVDLASGAILPSHL
ncbi:hypothetical protein ACQR1W_33830 [Bradyrhizobium sp. HKCCYLS1011]|uniref:hypothetical protein n=1 Tax=Bradyrhizobium sp. HKCCYLS1011 TaxID=3420733 RepID=UPI003EBAA067